MSERAYVQPQAIVGTLKYMNPNSEDITTDKILNKNDSPIQKLNPEDTDQNVYLADPQLCDGLIMYIFNSSSGTGKLMLYCHDMITLKLAILPQTMIQVMCIDNQWYAFFSGVINGGTEETTVTPITDPTLFYSKDEVNSLFANLTYGSGTTGSSVPVGSLVYYTKYEIDYMFQHITYDGGTNVPATSGPETWYTKIEIDNMFANLSYA